MQSAASGNLVRMEKSIHRHSLRHFEHRAKQMTIANYITIGRILLIPVFVLFAWIYGQSVLDKTPMEFYRAVAIIAFAFAGIGDWLDGFVARRWNQQSRLGSFLDPIADKFLIFSGIMLLSWVPWGENDWKIPVWYAWMAVLRDLSIATAVALIYAFNKKVVMRVNFFSKLNTVAQLVMLGWVMLKIVPFSPVYPTYICAALILLSSYSYTMETIRQISIDQGEDASAEKENVIN